VGVLHFFGCWVRGSPHLFFPNTTHYSFVLLKGGGEVSFEDCVVENMSFVNTVVGRASFISAQGSGCIVLSGVVFRWMGSVVTGGVIISTPSSLLEPLSLYINVRDVTVVDVEVVHSNVGGLFFIENIDMGLLLLLLLMFFN
jgi:hypothetical protein